MAMSLKKITAIAVGGAMVASTLASGVAAETVVIGDVDEFMKNVVKDGKPNVDIVVGSKAAAMDVVAAADIAAKIGSMCYKEATIEDGLAKLGFTASADSELTFDLKGIYPNDTEIILMAAPRSSYTSGLLPDLFTLSGQIEGLEKIVEGLISVNISKAVIDPNVRRLSTLVRDSDADPNDVNNNDKSEDAIEFLLTNVYKKDNETYIIPKKGMLYGTLMFEDGKKDFAHISRVHIGMEMPFLGEIYRIVDVDGKSIYLGKDAYSGILRDGEIVDIGNGYQVKVKKVLVSIETGDTKVAIEILKDGKVVKSADEERPYVLRHGEIGVIVYDAHMDIPRDYGYASLIITKDVKEYKLGEKFDGDWKLYAIAKDDNRILVKKTKFDTEEDTLTDYITIQVGSEDLPVCGLALRYEGDEIKDLDIGDVVEFVNDYAMVEFTDDDEEDKLYAKYKMEISKDVTLDIGQKIEILNAEIELKDIKATAQEVVPIETPIAKLDTEASLDTDKYLILVGGPVANKLTEELQKQGKVNINNDSPATLQVVDGRILVVAGGDRHKTREAALYLIQNY
ncbi:MAG TPA: S-layer protein [Methanothermococcus okinawensis]|uniref:S-layer protein n=1 Tax=Methanothermococcus okinawensis TaxID=155863 RepID=A0A833ECB4_9EURY|nr:S-layer protein [Methanothermococcus okinawensis]